MTEKDRLQTDEIKKCEEQLAVILSGCEECKAKMCKSCPNGKRKRALKGRILEMLPPPKNIWQKMDYYFKYKL